MARNSKEIWQHNSFHGYAKMTEVNMRGIINSRTATDKAIVIADNIRLLAIDLKKALKERKPLV